MRFIRKNLDLILFPAAIVALAFALQAIGFAKISYLELCGILMLIIARVLQKRELPAGLVVSILGNIALICYFSALGLPGQVALCAFAVAMNIAALHSWLVPSRKTKKIIRPTFLHPLWQAAVVLTVAAAAAFGAETRGAVGALDYFVMATGIIGILLLVRKKTDCWAMYAAGDVAGVALFWLTGSYLMLATMFVYVYTDLAAFFRWRRLSRKLKKISVGRPA